MSHFPRKEALEIMNALVLDKNKICVNGETHEILDRAGAIETIRCNWKGFLLDIRWDDALCRLVEEGSIGVFGGTLKKQIFLEEMKHTYLLISESIGLGIYDIRVAIDLLGIPRNRAEGNKLGAITRRVHGFMNRSK